MTIVGWSKTERIGAGLKNRGNTCYLNSVMQCLAYTPPLFNYLRTREHEKACLSQQGCTVCNTSLLILNMHKNTRPIAPDFILKNLRKIAPTLRIGRQEDSHEWLRYLLGSMQTALEKEQSKQKLPVGVAETTWLCQMFGGYIVNQLTCQTCQHVSRRADHFMDLSLEIMGCRSLLDSLRQFTRPEKLEGSNAWKCDKCEKLRPALKQMKIAQAPPVLTIQLKCFTPLGKKRSKHVQFESTLNLDDYMSRKDETPTLYSLYAVLVHSGPTTRSGHYTSFVKASNGVWFHMDDDRQRQVGAQTVLKQNAYMLFYVRQPQAVAKRAPAIPLPLPGQPPMTKKMRKLERKKRRRIEQEAKEKMDAKEKADAERMPPPASPARVVAPLVVLPVEESTILPERKNAPVAGSNTSNAVVSLLTKDLKKPSKRPREEEDESERTPEANGYVLKTSNALTRTASVTSFESWDESDPMKKKQDYLRAQEEEKLAAHKARPGLLDPELDKGKQKKKRNRVTDMPADAKLANDFTRIASQKASNKDSRRVKSKNTDFGKKVEHAKKKVWLNSRNKKKKNQKRAFH